MNLKESFFWLFKNIALFICLLGLLISSSFFNLGTDVKTYGCYVMLCYVTTICVQSPRMFLSCFTFEKFL